MREDYNEDINTITDMCCHTLSLNTVELRPFERLETEYGSGCFTLINLAHLQTSFVYDVSGMAPLRPSVFETV